MSTQDVNLAIHHNEKVQKAYIERNILLDRCQYDEDLRKLCLAKAAKDPIWFCNNFVTTYNPRVKPSIIPFILFPRQEDMVKWMLHCYENGKWGTIVKCRYTGASYVTLMLLLHKLMFEPDFTGSLASNKADSVDKTNSNKSLFFKLIQMYNWLPNWFKTFDIEKAKTRMLIYNPLINSAIMGESGSEIGRGGRSSMAMVDEAAFVEADQAMVAALSENTDCAIFVSTPKGKANQFYQLSQSSVIEKFYFRWESDPRRTPEWRYEQDLKLGEAIAAQELDCDFDADSEGTFIDAKWVKACINAHLVIPELEKENKPIQAGLDVAVQGRDKTVLTIRHGSVVEEIITLPGNYPTQTALLVRDELRGSPVHSLCFDADGVGVDIAGAFANMEEDTNYTLVKFHGSGKPSERIWDGVEATSREMFFNKRAEAWGLLKWRIKNTYDHINGLQEYEPWEMISIPDEPQLLIDLTKPTINYKGGRLLLESKKEMRSRGIDSPDYADSLAYAFYEEGNTGWWVTQL